MDLVCLAKNGFPQYQLRPGYHVSFIRDARHRFDKETEFAGGLAHIALWLPQFQDVKKVDREFYGALVDVFGGAQMLKEACDGNGLDGVSLGIQLSQTLDFLCKTAPFNQATGDYACMDVEDSSTHSY